MFTGIVQSTGRVAELTRTGRGARLRVHAPLALLRRLKPGDSIAVNGCCLTIVARRGGAFAADLAPETLHRTALGGLAPGASVNLEPPLRAGDALSGHLMQGHVDGVGRLLGLDRVEKRGRDRWLRLRIPPDLLRYVTWKGSLAVDGISLTVASLHDAEAGFAIIPFTLRHTHLASLSPGAAVNLETDPLARHLERLLAATRPHSATLTLARLRRLGY